MNGSEAQRADFIFKTVKRLFLKLRLTENCISEIAELKIYREKISYNWFVPLEAYIVTATDLKNLKKIVYVKTNN